LIGKPLIIFPIFGVAGKVQGFSVNDADGAKGVPEPVAGHSGATADNVDRHDGGAGAGRDQSDARLGWPELAIVRALAFGKKDESSAVLEHLENIFQGGGTGRLLVDGDGADGGKEPRAHGGGKERVTGEVVGDSRKTAADGGWIQVTSVVGS